MIRYSYNQQFQPPAPFVHVTIRTPRGEQMVADVPALLDTAADITVVPGRISDELHLVPLDEISIEGFDRHVTCVPTFLVQVSLRQLEPVVVKVVVGREEPFVLLGRDILNQYRVLFDGRQLRLEID
jgi:predicted aspartyl protease